ncbi:DUF1918 domain-containing protein [Spongiactinospora sp. TRM90649]|uniref:DUF1918 domain-containing protein n=1 Tax=Spongiactinospora sp. TRM90649 TaxID=3031114 RepID=UPI0023F86D9D|nr:DUF1918 domain-containing protein [Spongiactinospora sp. TRM90649]MDF5755240.1 DUF1918 domain-containing protein [Spongiactinospora sp. TRM90649]
MKAAVGDRLIVEHPTLGGSRRVGVITEVRNDDGSPPYTVHWLDQEHTTLVFPGPDAHVEHAEQTATHG